MTSDFENAVKKLSDENSEIEYMSNPDNWLIVHTTKYMPEKLKNGQMAIKTTAMATDFEIPRATVHTTLNHIVVGTVGFGSWTDTPYVILAPYKDVVKQNGNPLQLSVFDTFFAPDIKTGLVLPIGTRLVRPGDVSWGELYEIKGNETLYKMDGFTPQQKQFIYETYMDKYQRREYDNLGWRDDFTDDEIQMMLDVAGKSARGVYDSARDKNAVIRGMCIDAQNAFLSNVVRDVATRETCKNMGYRYIEYVADASSVAHSAASAAVNMGGVGIDSNKGHSLSPSYYLEKALLSVDDLLHDGAWFRPGGLMSKLADFDTLYDFIKSGYDNGADVDVFVRDLIGVSSLDSNLHKNADGIIACNNRNPEGVFKSVGEYNKNIAATTDKWITRICGEYNKWRDGLRVKQGYDKFIARLRKMYNARKMVIARDVNER